MCKTSSTGEILGQIAHITGNTCICIINVWGCTDMICHQNLIPLFLKALLGNYRLRCYKLVNFKNKISRLSNLQNREHLKYLKTVYCDGSGHTCKPQSNNLIKAQEAQALWNFVCI